MKHHHYHRLPVALEHRRIVTLESDLFRAGHRAVNLIHLSDLVCGPPLVVQNVIGTDTNGEKVVIPERSRLEACLFQARSCLLLRHQVHA